METNEKTETLGWTRDELLDVLCLGDKEIRERIEAEGITDDEDAAAAIKDYEEGPQQQISNDSLCELLAISASLGKHEEGKLDPIDSALFFLDIGRSHEKNCLAASDAWKDKPYGETVPAPIPSALKFGKEGIDVSWAARFLWLIIVLALNWIAWAIIS